MDESTFDQHGSDGCPADVESVTDVPDSTERESGSSGAREFLEQTEGSLSHVGVGLFVQMLPLEVQAEAKTVLEGQEDDEKRHKAAMTMLHTVRSTVVAQEEAPPEEKPMSRSMVEAFMMGHTE